mmetsp:Transcript_6342/g.26283  ORF Transcript_6342/g.26283 Transcript_6342/m.26283 type:complete len:314 (+) Transcript_6342:608-1549(+)
MRAVRDGDGRHAALRVGIREGPQELAGDVVVRPHVAVRPPGHEHLIANAHAHRRHRGGLDLRPHRANRPRVEVPSLERPVAAAAHHRLRARVRVRFGSPIAEIRGRGGELHQGYGVDVRLLEQNRFRVGDARFTSLDVRDVFSPGGGAHHHLRVPGAITFVVHRAHRRHPALERPHVVQRVEDGGRFVRVKDADAAVAAADEVVPAPVHGHEHLRRALAARRPGPEDAPARVKRGYVSALRSRVELLRVRAEDARREVPLGVAGAALLASDEPSAGVATPDDHLFFARGPEGVVRSVALNFGRERDGVGLPRG